MMQYNLLPLADSYPSMPFKMQKSGVLRQCIDCGYVVLFLSWQFDHQSSQIKA